MMIRFFFIYLICISLGCSNKSSNNILNEKSFKSIIKEMVEAETFVTSYIIKDSTKKHKDETLKLYDKIFVLHKTNKEQVQKSLQYYMQKPQMFKIMLDSIQVQARKLDIALPIKTTLE